MKNTTIKTKTITYKDLTGQKFGKLTVLKLDHIQIRTRYWLCECDCTMHNKKVVKEVYLINGNTRSCGCLRNKANKPFMTSDAMLTENNRKLYGVWKNTYHRCLNKDNKKYIEYGAKGITLCEEWKEFNTFSNWCFANGYKDGLALIRKDVHGNYEPNNCVWDYKANYHKIQKEYAELLEKENNNIIDLKNYIKINNQDVEIIEYNGQRVVTFNDIDLLHNKNDGTAQRNFYNNKKYFQEGVHYFNFKGSKGREALIQANLESFTKLKSPNFSFYLITEKGYLNLVKSFDDSLSWKVQSQLVDCYFEIKALKTSNKTKNIPAIKDMNSMDILENIVNTFKQQQTQINILSNDYSTLNDDYTSLKQDHEELKNKINNMVRAIS